MEGTTAAKRQLHEDSVINEPKKKFRSSDDERKIISSVPFVGKTGIKYFDSQKQWKSYRATSEKVENNDEFGFTWNTDFTCSLCANIIPSRLLYFCFMCSTKTRQFFCEDCVEICPEDECTLICNTCQPDGFIQCDTDGCETNLSCPTNPENSFCCTICEDNNIFCGECMFDCNECGKEKKVCSECSETKEGKCDACGSILCYDCAIVCKRENCGLRYCNRRCSLDSDDCVFI